MHGVSAAGEPLHEVVAALSDDLNTSSAMSIIHGVAKSARRNPEAAADLKATLQFMGLIGDEKAGDLDTGRAALDIDEGEIARQIKARGDARRARDFKESDRIRDALAAKGVQLKDTKNPLTGEIETTWEVKR